MLFDAAPINKAKLAPLQVRAPDIEKWLLARDPMASGAFGSMGADEYAKSFTAARTAGTDIADDLYFALVDTISGSGTEADFSSRVLPILKAKGWLGSDVERATRVALIYDTNLRLARAAGRWDNVQATKTVLPYLRAFTVEDDRVRRPPKSKSDHRAWDGIVLPADHTFWLKWWPPLGFRCRCGVEQLSRSDLARLKGGVTSEDELAWRDQRLGQPIFATPGVPLVARLATMVAPTNADRMPGMPAVDPVATRAQGLSAWQAALTAGALDAIDALIAQLFGN